MFSLPEPVSFFRLDILGPMPDAGFVHSLAPCQVAGHRKSSSPSKTIMQKHCTSCVRVAGF